MFLPVTPSGLVPVTAVGEPVLVKEVPGGVGKQVVVDLGTLQACLVSEDSAGKLGRLESATFFADQPVILQAIALIRNRREQRFDPRTGRQLDYPAPGIVGRDPHDEKRLVFPRLDPAVIGLIRLSGTDRILLARNRRRNSLFSLIAGYVEPGETAEAAFAREALEETGRRWTIFVIGARRRGHRAARLCWAFVHKRLMSTPPAILMGNWKRSGGWSAPSCLGFRFLVRVQLHTR